MRNQFILGMLVGLGGILVGCATGEPVSERPRTPQTAAHFERVIDNAAVPTRRSTPELPTVRAASPRFLAAGPLSARIEVCVGQSGDTASVKLAASSGDRSYDQAILDDVARWRYEPLRNAGLACEQATVTYVP